MKIVQIQFSSWDKVYNFSSNNLSLEEGDKVIVKTEIGVEMGEVVGFTAPDKDDSGKDDKVADKTGDKTEEIKADEKEDKTNNPSTPQQNSEQEKKDESTEEPKKQERELKPILRIASERDREKLSSLADKKKALDFCKEMKKKYDLPMKFIDVHFAFDGSRITFAFIADGRVDFRELVKDLTRHFGRTIRLQQIGIRDEAKIMGDFGHCGNELCCRGPLKTLTSITSEMAELQQCSHRGSDRISGICGRLMCCLAYEQSGYEELYVKLPPIGTKVNVDGKRGVIVGHHTLKQSVDVEFTGDKPGDKTRIEIDLNRNKEKKE